MSASLLMASMRPSSAGLRLPVQHSARPFTAHAPRLHSRRGSVCNARASSRTEQEQSQTQQHGVTGAAAAAVFLAPLLLHADPASAAGNFLLTGKTVSLVHPAIMLFLFGSTAWTGWLGWQWRRARTIPAEVKELKAQLPKPDAEGNRASSPLDAQIAELESTRKELLKGNYREVHWNWGSLLLGLGVLIAIEGPVNTYLRTGKLFPGPHLYAGAAIVVLWAAASSLVPSMQKGSDSARNAHIALNTLNLALFAWQVPTGFEIVQKVWEGVPWP